MWALTESHDTSAGKVAAGRAGNGPPLILAHGWPWSSYSWHKVILALAENHHVHWYDMPGYGQSDKDPDQRTSLDVQGQVFAEMIDNWQITNPTIIAHDFGGATTLRAHLLHGCDFDRYVLMNVVAMRPWGSDFFDHVGKHVEAFQGLPPHIHKAIVEAYIQGALISDIGTEVFHTLVAPWLTVEGASSFYRQFAQADEVYTAEVEPLFDRIRCPVHMIWGEDDPWIPIARGKALHGLVGKGQFVPLPNVGHLPQLEAPKAVLNALEGFL